MSIFARYRRIVLFVKCGYTELLQKLTWVGTVLAPHQFNSFLPYLTVDDSVWSVYIDNSY